MVNDFESVAVPLLAVTVPWNVPLEVDAGARWMFPVVGLVVVTVMKVGPTVLEKVSGIPSGSVPLTA